MDTVTLSSELTNLPKDTLLRLYVEPVTHPATRYSVQVIIPENDDVATFLLWGDTIKQITGKRALAEVTSRMNTIAQHNNKLIRGVIDGIIPVSALMERLNETPTC